MFLAHETGIGNELEQEGNSLAPSNVYSNEGKKWFMGCGK
jgi:hypothetical protein